MDKTRIDMDNILRKTIHTFDAILIFPASLSDNYYIVGHFIFKRY
jgi:hypothetical protein